MSVGGTRAYLILTEIAAKVSFIPHLCFDVRYLECKAICSAASNNMKLVHWPLMGGLLHLVQRGGDRAGPQPAQAPPRCTKCNSPPINGQCIPIIV